MLRYKKSRARYGVQIPLTSLIDVVFLLLIYFLLTTNFIVEEGIKVSLPKAQAVVPYANAEVIVHIDRDARIFLQQDQVGVPLLLTRLRERVKQNDNLLVIVKADRTVMVDNVVEVMDVAKAAGVHRLLLATERSF